MRGFAVTPDTLWKRGVELECAGNKGWKRVTLPEVAFVNVSVEELFDAALTVAAAPRSDSVRQKSMTMDMRRRHAMRE